MSCYGCAAKFNFFNKEHGCPNCGFSHCAKCLKYKAVIPKLGKKEHLVCKSCQVALTNIETKSAQQDHPAACLQRLESLENPARPPITVYQHDHRMQQLKTGLTQTDREIADRLEKLRDDRKREPLPSEDEIAKRLALLKGEEPMQISTRDSKAMIVSHPRSQQQEAEDLIKQFQEEQELSLKQPNPVEDISFRLARLRGYDQSSQAGNKPTEAKASAKSIDGGSDSFGVMSLDEVNALLAELRKEEKCNVADNRELEASVKSCLKDIRSKLMKGNGKQKEDSDGNSETDEDDDVAAQKVMRKAFDEAALEEKLALSDDSDEDNVDEDELPWCVICDKNATLKCLDCSGDQYCDSCFKEGHRDFDMKDHKAVAFKAVKK